MRERGPGRRRAAPEQLGCGLEEKKLRASEKKEGGARGHPEKGNVGTRKEKKKMKSKRIKKRKEQKN